MKLDIYKRGMKIKPAKFSSKLALELSEKNLNDLYIRASQHENYESNISRNIQWVLAKKSDWPNCIFMADLRNLDANHEIREVKRLISKNKAPNGWTIGPSSFPKNLGKLLEKNGFSNVYHQSAMALNLKDLEFNKSDLKKLKVKLIKNEKDIDTWAKVVSLAFNIKVDMNFLQQLFHDPKASFYIGIFEAEPVSSLLIFNSSGVSGLYAVSTLSDCRGRGFGVKISGYALLDAFNKGFKMAVLHASDLGFKVYQKLGFKKYGDIYSYELQ